MERGNSMVVFSCIMHHLSSSNIKLPHKREPYFHLHPILIFKGTVSPEMCASFVLRHLEYD
jgi:hypothetical protein